MKVRKRIRTRVHNKNRRMRKLVASQAGSGGGGDQPKKQNPAPRRVRIARNTHASTYEIREEAKQEKKERK